MNERQPEREEARPVALANAPSQAVADQCQTVKTRKRNYRCVLTWFASRWRNHQPKRAEKPHSKVNAARRWPALLRGRKELRLPWRIASGSWQPLRDERLMSAREREPGELPTPICPCLIPLCGIGQGLFVLSFICDSPGASRSAAQTEPPNPESRNRKAKSAP